MRRATIGREASPHRFLEEWLEQLPGGRALDLACGTGRNAMRLAEAGYETDAIDVSQVAIERAKDQAADRGLAVNWRAADLDDVVLPEAHYDLITVIRFANRDLWPRLASALTPGGALLVEHHLVSTATVDGPQSADFRLRPNELLEAFAGLRIMFYAEAAESADRSDGLFALARMVAYNGNPGF